MKYDKDTWARAAIAIAEESLEQATRAMNVAANAMAGAGQDETEMRLAIDLMGDASEKAWPIFQAQPEEPGDEDEAYTSAKDDAYDLAIG